MFCVHVAGDELDALAHDFRQNGFAISVNGCHLDQLNDAPPRVPYVARFSPSRLELRRPLADQLTLQRPPLLIGQIGYCDLQHYSPSTARIRRSEAAPSAIGSSSRSGGALQEVIFDLDRGYGRPASEVRRIGSGNNAPRRKIGKAPIDNLTGPHQIV